MPIRDIIIEDIDGGHYDEELGEMVRDPRYSEYNAMEIKSLLVDRIVDGLAPQHSGKWLDKAVWAVGVFVLAALIILIRWERV